MGSAAIVCASLVPWLGALAQGNARDPDAATGSPPAAKCLADGKGFFRARLQGSLKADLDWGNEGTECTGALRPMAASGLVSAGRSMATTSVSSCCSASPGSRRARRRERCRLYVTVIRQGTGEFYGTQGDDKCTLDEVRQEPIAGIPLRNRLYRITARGFCIQPARSLRDEGAVLMTRFDFSGRIDFSEVGT